MMAQSFEITATETSVTLDVNRQGTAVYKVRNKTNRAVRGEVRIVAEPPANAWLTLVGAEGGAPASRRFLEMPIAGEADVQVRIAPPATALPPPNSPPASYTFSIAVADEVEPEINVTTGPNTTFVLAAPPVEVKRSTIPVWLIGAVLAALVIVGLVVVLVIQNGQLERLRNDGLTATAHINETAAVVFGNAQTQTRAAVIAAETAAFDSAILTAVSGTLTQAAQDRVTPFLPPDIVVTFTNICVIRPQLCGVRFDPDLIRPFSLESTPPAP